MLRTMLFGLLICLSLTACDPDSTDPSEAQEAAAEPSQAEAQPLEDLQMCNEDQRPEMCAQFYKPVCGQLKDASEKTETERKLKREWKTFSNGCTACADHQVVGYRPGACDEPQAE